MKTNTLLIKTPEGILFPLLLASPVTRALAWSMDFICVMAATIAISKVASVMAILSEDFAAAFFVLAYNIISIGYGIGSEWLWRGQTVGKRLFRLRVMDAQGLRLQFSQIVIRNLLRFVDNLPMFYLVGGLACLLNRRAQRLGDFAANTIVVRHPLVTEPDLDQLMAGKFNSFHDYPHLKARLRQRISPAEAAIALQALIRRDEFDPAARVELFSQLATHFRSVVHFPQEAVEGITDEQYIRNVVDVIFRVRQNEEKEAAEREAKV